MNKKLSTNSYLRFINGYLDSLSDIDGEQREFFVSFSMIQSENISIESELKLAYDFMEDIEIVKNIKYPNKCCFTHFLEKLLLIKPFKGLYEISNNVYIPDNVIKAYRDYIIFHLEDYLDFALEEEENKISLYDSTICLFLVKYKNNRDNSISYFISIQKEVKNIKQFLNFYRKDYTEENFIQYFNEIVRWEKQRKQESKEKFLGIK
jgi:hypothetical protein